MEMQLSGGMKSNKYTGRAKDALSNNSAAAYCSGKTLKR